MVWRQVFFMKNKSTKLNINKMTKITFPYWLLRVTDCTDDLIQVWEKISIVCHCTLTDKNTKPMGMG